VIKTVALGVACLAGLGAITAVAKKSTPSASPEIVLPVAAGNKADRLPLMVNQGTPAEAEKVNVAYVPPSEQAQAALPPSALPEPTRPPHHDVTRRHGHEPHHLKTKATKRTASSTKHAEKRSADHPPIQVSEMKECRSDGLAPLLRKLSLSPSCN
jgi:hypothetical protein